MYKFFFILTVLVGMETMLASPSPAQTSTINDHKCDYLINPIGVDNPQPRFTWKWKDGREGAKQTAFQVLVGTDSIQVKGGKGVEWNTGILKSSITLVAYKGAKLRPFTKYFWTVIGFDQYGKKCGSEVASFETGMMGTGNWNGSWISDSGDIDTKPAPYFRTQFGLKKRVKSARVYVAAAGLYELYINGNKIGNHRLDPVYTRFDRRILYVTYDVTSAIKSGQNALGVLLGNGWYNHQSTAVWDFHKAPWRNRPAFCLDLRLTYEDGTVQTIASGKDWRTSLSPLIFNSIYTAEHYDARLEQAGWNAIDFDDRTWKEVKYRAAPSLNIVSQQLHPIRAIEKITVQGLKKFNDTSYVFDLGRNIAGVSRIKVKAEAGTIIRLKHAERLYADGHADQSNIDIHYRPTDDKDPFQTDIFITSGKGEETFEPRFNYKGFQYVEVTSSRPILLDKESLTGVFMHTDVPVAGTFNSSNPIVNKIWQATNNSYLSNLFGYPTDCPQREKNGWTCDGQIAVETGLYNFDGITVYEKWMADHRDEQQPNGVLPAIIPTAGWGYEWANGPDWTSSIAIIPWNIYLFYGDQKVLVDCYDNIKKYVDHITSLSPNGLTEWGLGDWVPVKSKSSVELTSSTYYYTDVSILAKAAKVLGKTSDYTKYHALALKIRNAINDKYLNTQTGIYASGTQTELSVPLFWGLVPEGNKQKVAANLAERVKSDHFHLDVGLLGSKAILNSLSENGYADIAYKVASQETFPSWGWWMVNGATTLYENWPIDAKSDISLNHIMFGEIGAWLYKALGGIKPDPEHPGFKNILIEPHFVEGLEHLDTTHDGPNGWINSSWKRVGDKILYRLIVPANSSATVHLPFTSHTKLSINGKAQKVNPISLSGLTYTYQALAGTYVFEIDNHKSQ